MGVKGSANYNCLNYSTVILIRIGYIEKISNEVGFFKISLNLAWVHTRVSEICLFHHFFEVFPYAINEVIGIKGLGDVIICPHVNTVDDVVP